jgi:hypothetical protein
VAVWGFLFNLAQRKADTPLSFEEPGPRLWISERLSLLSAVVTMRKLRLSKRDFARAIKSNRLNHKLTSIMNDSRTMDCLAAKGLSFISPRLFPLAFMA